MSSRKLLKLNETPESHPTAFGLINFELILERMAPQFRETAAMIIESSASGVGIVMVSAIGYFTDSWISYLYGQAIMISE